MGFPEIPTVTSLNMYDNENVWDRALLIQETEPGVKKGKRVTTLPISLKHGLFDGCNAINMWLFSRITQ